MLWWTRMPRTETMLPEPVIADGDRAAARAAEAAAPRPAAGHGACSAAILAASSLSGAARLAASDQPAVEAGLDVGRHLGLLVAGRVTSSRRASTAACWRSAAAAASSACGRASSRSSRARSSWSRTSSWDDDLASSSDCFSSASPMVSDARESTNARDVGGRTKVSTASSLTAASSCGDLGLLGHDLGGAAPRAASASAALRSASRARRSGSATLALSVVSAASTCGVGGPERVDLRRPRRPSCAGPRPARTSVSAPRDAGTASDGRARRPGGRATESTRPAVRRGVGWGA